MADEAADESNRVEEGGKGLSPGMPADTSKKPWWRRTWVIFAAAVPVVGVLPGILSFGWGIIGPLVVPSPTPNLSVTRDAGPPASPGPLASTGAAATPGGGWTKDFAVSYNDPVAVKARMDPGNFCHGALGWVFPKAPAELTALPYTAQTSGLDAWARANGGIPRSGNAITLTLQEQKGESIVIDSIHARVVGRAAPKAVSVPQLSGGCGGATQSYFVIDLDKGDSPEAQPESGTPAPGVTAPPIPLPHKLDPGDQIESWNIRVVSTGCDCRFVLSFDLSLGSQRATYDVTLADGQPWHVSADTGARWAVRSGSDGIWLPAPNQTTLP